MLHAFVTFLQVLRLVISCKQDAHITFFVNRVQRNNAATGKCQSTI